MRAGGDFGHDTAERRVQIGLTDDDRGEDLRRLSRSMPYDRRGGVVAAGFEAEDGEGIAHGAHCSCTAKRGNTGGLSTQSRRAMPDLPLLLLTRPEAQSTRLLAELEAEAGRKLPAMIAPVLRIERIGPEPELAEGVGVILTSANGARFAPDLARRNVFAVGERTAEAARRKGGHIALVAQDADALVTALCATPPAFSVVHLSGRHRRGQIAERLNEAGIETEVIEIYDQVAQPLSDQACAALEGAAPVLLPLFSPRSARLVATGIARPGPGLEAIALSAAVAEEWQARTGVNAAVCRAPSGREMRREILARLRR